MSDKNALYERITEQMVQALEAGTVPWRTPWRPGQTPRNATGGYAYRGVNVFMLLLAQAAKGYASPYWLTFRQAQAMGGAVRKGEKGQIIVFWKMIKVVDKETGEPKTVPLLRYSTVFNTEQCDGLTLPKKVQADLDRTGEAVLSDEDRIAAAEAIVAGYENRPAIRQTAGSGRAFYVPSLDVIDVPAISDYEVPGEFYSTLFHEIGHSTGHKSRLNRHSDEAVFGNHAYGREELVAEMTAAFLCAESGIENTHDNSAAYLASWVRTIREDVKAVVVAAGQAQKAADLVLGRVREDSNEEKEAA